MIQDIKNICSRKHIKLLIILFLGMFIAAAIEMVGLGSIPIFIMIIVDIDVLINKFPTFFLEKTHFRKKSDFFLIEKSGKIRKNRKKNRENR